MTDTANILTKLNELEEEVEILREQGKMFPGYLSGLSHDIRTPLNAIIGFAGLLTEPGVTKKEQIFYSKMIRRSSRKLLTLISNLIDLAKLETGSLNILSEPTNLTELFEDLEDEMIEERTIYDKGNLKLSIDKPSNGTTIMDTDRARLFQVLKILFDNSLKYTDQGEIQLGAFRDNDRTMRFILKDTGKGIDRETLDNLYTLFPVTSLSSGMKIKSRGLGMLVAKRLVEKMNGGMKVESEPGKGTRVSLIFP